MIHCMGTQKIVQAWHEVLDSDTSYLHVLTDEGKIYYLNGLATEWVEIELPKLPHTKIGEIA